jgi:ABC-type multidrug transport system ATPase subunit
MPRPAILAEGLTKSLGQVRVLNGIGFAASEGTVLGLLGPNGAGKTTAVRILCTLLRPDSGRAEVLGRDVVREAQRAGARSGSPASTPPWTTCCPRGRTST